MPLDLEEEVSAATVTGNTVTGIYSNYSSELHNLCTFIRGHFVNWGLGQWRELPLQQCWSSWQWSL